MDFVSSLFTRFEISESWYPVILIGIIFVCLLIVYLGCVFIRSFLSWLWRIDTLIRETQETNELLAEILSVLDGTQSRNTEILAQLQGSPEKYTTNTPDIPDRSMSPDESHTPQPEKHRNTHKKHRKRGQKHPE